MCGALSVRCSPGNLCFVQHRQKTNLINWNEERVCLFGVRAQLPISPRPVLCLSVCLSLHWFASRRQHTSAHHPPLLPAAELPAPCRLLPIELELRAAWGQLEASLPSSLPSCNQGTAAPTAAPALQTLILHLCRQSTATALFAAASTALDCKHQFCRLFQQTRQMGGTVPLVQLAAAVAPQLDSIWKPWMQQKHSALNEQLKVPY